MQETVLTTTYVSAIFVVIVALGAGLPLEKVLNGGRVAEDPGEDVSKELEVMTRASSDFGQANPVHVERDANREDDGSLASDCQSA